jgi:hypothetical protein
MLGLMRADGKELMSACQTITKALSAERIIGHAVV